MHTVSAIGQKNIADKLIYFFTENKIYVILIFT